MHMPLWEGIVKPRGKWPGTLGPGQGPVELKSHAMQTLSGNRKTLLDKYMPEVDPENWTDT